MFLRTRSFLLLLFPLISCHDVCVSLSCVFLLVHLPTRCTQVTQHTYTNVAVPSARVTCERPYSHAEGGRKGEETPLSTKASSLSYVCYKRNRIMNSTHYVFDFVIERLPVEMIQLWNWKTALETGLDAASLFLNRQQALSI